MLATVTLATTEEPWRTWLGSTFGMVAADAIAIAIGAFFGARLPERWVKLFAAAAFVVFGLLLIGEGLDDVEDLQRSFSECVAQEALSKE